MMSKLPFIFVVMLVIDTGIPSAFVITRDVKFTNLKVSLKLW